MKFITFLFFSVGYSIFNVFGATLIKKKLASETIIGFRDFFVFLVDFQVVLAIFFIFISMFLSIKALALSSFSTAIPIMTGVNFLLTVCVGALYFQDKLIFTTYLGVALVLLGIAMIGYSALDG